MNELISYERIIELDAAGSPTITSLKIAEVFGRRHDDVLRSIRRELAAEIGLRVCAESSYLNLQGKEQPMFRLNEEQALYITPFIGGRKSREGQKALVAGFLHYRQQSQQLKVLSPAQLHLQLAGIVVDIERRVFFMGTKQEELEDRIESLEHPEGQEAYYQINAYAKLHGYTMLSPAKMGYAAAKLSKEQGRAINKTWSKQFGISRAYSEEVLNSLFESAGPEKLYLPRG